MNSGIMRKSIIVILLAWAITGCATNFSATDRVKQAQVMESLNGVPIYKCNGSRLIPRCVKTN